MLSNSCTSVPAKSIIFNAVSGLIQLNEEEINTPEYLLSKPSNKKNYNPINFERNGWYISKLCNASDRTSVDELQIELMIPFKDRKVWNQVFNTVPASSTICAILDGEELTASGGSDLSNVRKDGGRNQIYIDKSESKAMQSKARKVADILKPLIYEELNLGGKSSDDGPNKRKKKPKNNGMFLTALETEAPAFNHKTGFLDWVPNQLLHSDTDPAKFNDFRANQFIGFIATNPGVTYIRVITGSHNFGAESCKKSSYIHVVALEQYEYFVVKPTLIHGGASNKPRYDDKDCCDNKMSTRQSGLLVAEKVSSGASSAEADELVCEAFRHRNSRLHFYCNLPISATKNTYFYVHEHAYAQIELRGKSANMAMVRDAKKRKHLTFSPLRMASYEQVRRRKK